MEIEEEVKELIDCHGESDYWDFKEEDYHKENKVELVKDIIAFANSHSIRNKYIIIGIKEKNNVCEEIKGIDKEKVKDEAEFQQIIRTYIKDDLIFEFKNVRWKTTFNGGGLSPISKTLYGNENEIDRYWKLKELDNYILEYLAINYYFKGLPKIYNTNLVLSNIANYFDEDIENIFEDSIYEENDKIKIDYEIKSKNNSKTVYGRIES